VQRQIAGLHTRQVSPSAVDRLCRAEIRRLPASVRVSQGSAIGAGPSPLARLHLSRRRPPFRTRLDPVDKAYDQGEPDRFRASLQHGAAASLSVITTIDVMAAGHRPGKPFRPGSSDWALNEDMTVGNWWAVAPSSTKQQIEPEQVRSARQAVAGGKAAPHGIG
jgi:hypothetical protein